MFSELIIKDDDDDECHIFFATGNEALFSIGGECADLTSLMTAGSITNQVKRTRKNQSIASGCIICDMDSVILIIDF